MKARTNSKISLAIGIIFLFFGIGAIFNTIYLESGVAPILWMCYICMILLGIGSLRRDSFLIVSQLNLLAIPLLFWNIDFFYRLFSGHTVFGIVDYFFVSGPIFGKIISSQHLITLPLALFALWLIKLKKREAWKISLFQIVIVYLASRLTTNPIQNVNCVFHSCSNLTINFLPYWINWFAGYVIMIFATQWVIWKFFVGKKK